MAELQFDIHLEFDPAALAGEQDMKRTVAELSHRAALEAADEHRLNLRHPEPVAVHATDATDRLTGRPVVLVASRWVADTRG